MVHRFATVVSSMQATGRQVVNRDGAAIEARSIVVHYPGMSRPAVAGASLQASRGDMIALVGVNGAGKTSMINALLGVAQECEGTVLINGVDATRMDPSERLGHFGLLTQEFGRYEWTVRQSVALGTPGTAPSDQALWQALRASKMDLVISRLPQGLDAQLGQQWGGVGLSGGQWQRLALARICLRQAGIWVLDEPTSAIDAEAEEEIFDELYATKAERITIVVSHRAWTLRRMDRIYVFDQGRIVECGTYDELLSMNGRFARMFALQMFG